jgi:hypothetical protein
MKEGYEGRKERRKAGRKEGKLGCTALNSQVYSTFEEDRGKITISAYEHTERFVLKKNDG